MMLEGFGTDETLSPRTINARIGDLGVRLTPPTAATTPVNLSTTVGGLLDGCRTRPPTVVDKLLLEG